MNMGLLNVIIDLSHHNTVNNFQTVKNDGVLGVIHKATQGKTFVDGKYAERRRQALKAGLLWGAYHFGVTGDVEKQVDHFLGIVKPAATDLIALDFEPDPAGETMTLGEAETFVERVHTKTGRYPGLYASQAYLKEELGERTDTVLKNCFLWIARYSSQLPVLPPAFSAFALWQYTDGHQGPDPHEVNGIGPCDRDTFNGDEASLKKLWGY
jgi:lysozyme